MEATLDQAIQDGRLNLGITQRRNRVPPLIVGENEENVDLLLGPAAPDIARPSATR